MQLVRKLSEEICLNQGPIVVGVVKEMAVTLVEVVSDIYSILHFYLTSLSKTMFSPSTVDHDNSLIWQDLDLDLGL